MNLSPVDNSNLGLMAEANAAGMGALRSQKGSGFSSLLTGASNEAISAGKSKREQLREAVEQLVSSAFILPVLGQMRDSALNSDLFGGGFAEKSFQQQLDTVLADRMVSGGNFPLVDTIYQRFEGAHMMQRGGLVDTAA